MKVQKVQSSNVFKSNGHFLDKHQLENVHMLLNKMNSEITLEKSNDISIIRILNVIKIGEKAQLWDRRCLHEKSDSLKGDAMLDINSAIFNFNIETGEIKSFQKNWYTSWKSVMKKVTKTLNFALDSFDDNNIVKKEFVSLERAADSINQV